MTRRIHDKTTIDITKADRERVNELARQLTAEGPGTFGQRETIRWLLSDRDNLADQLAKAEARAAEMESRYDRLTLSLRDQENGQ